MSKRTIGPWTTRTIGFKMSTLGCFVFFVLKRLLPFRELILLILRVVRHLVHHGIVRRESLWITHLLSIVLVWIIIHRHRLLLLMLKLILLVWALLATLYIYILITITTLGTYFHFNPNLLL